MHGKENSSAIKKSPKVVDLKLSTVSAVKESNLKLNKVESLTDFSGNEF